MADIDPTQLVPPFIEPSVTNPDWDGPELCLYQSSCGHHFVGFSHGNFACPVCGMYDGDYHLQHMLHLPVQVDDFDAGRSWASLASQVKRLSDFEEDLMEELAERIHRDGHSQ